MSDRLLISKLQGSTKPWTIISNPAWSHTTRAQDMILHNTFNDYAEYYNCGVRYRMIRIKDAHKYGIKKDRIKPESILAQPPMNKKKLLKRIKYKLNARRYENRESSASTELERQRRAGRDEGLIMALGIVKSQIDKLTQD